MTRDISAPAIALALALTLTACGEAEDTSSETAQNQTTQSKESGEPEAAPNPGDGDRTEDLRSAASGDPWSTNIVRATETGRGRIEVETDLVDPRGDNGSAEAQTALQICEAAVSMLERDGVEKSYVAVMEEDGTYWVLHGHPAYPDGCTEG